MSTSNNKLKGFNMGRKEENNKKAPQFHKMGKEETKDVKREPVNEVKDKEPVNEVKDKEPVNVAKVSEPVNEVKDKEPVNEVELSYPILTRVVKDYQDSRARDKYSNETGAYKEAFLKTVMLGFRRKTFTQADVDYVSNLLCNVEGFGELELITSVSKQSLVDMVIFYFGKLEKTKITIVNLPMSGLHVGKIRKV